MYKYVIENFGDDYEINPYYKSFLDEKEKFKKVLSPRSLKFNKFKKELLDNF